MVPSYTDLRTWLDSRVCVACLRRACTACIPICTLRMCMHVCMHVHVHMRVYGGCATMLTTMTMTTARALSDSSVRRFALTRDPLERAQSAYYSKVACDTGDAADHAGAIRQLMRQAPKAAAAGLGAGSELNRSVPCLSAVDWGRMVLEARLNEATRWEVNAHFMPQADACGLHTIGYHMLIPLEDNTYGMQQIAASLGLLGRNPAGTAAGTAGNGGVGSVAGHISSGGGHTPARAPALGRRHMVSRSDKRALSSEAMELLARVYLQDLHLLQFPLNGKLGGVRGANGSVAARWGWLRGGGGRNGTSSAGLAQRAAVRAAAVRAAGGDAGEGSVGETQAGGGTSPPGLASPRASLHRGVGKGRGKGKGAGGRGASVGRGAGGGAHGGGAHGGGAHGGAMATAHASSKRSGSAGSVKGEGPGAGPITGSHHTPTKGGGKAKGVGGRAGGR